MYVTRKSQSANILGAVRIAQAKGLYAAALVLQNAVKRGLAGGYTSGNFVTGTNIKHVLISEPSFNPDGSGEIRVGTDLNPCYPLFWELGHFNIFTRKYERVEVWRPAYEENRQAAIEAFRRVFKRWVNTFGVPTGSSGVVDAALGSDA